MKTKNNKNDKENRRQSSRLWLDIIFNLNTINAFVFHSILCSLFLSLFHSRGAKKNENKNAKEFI